MWNVKTTVIPVIIRATGNTSKSFAKYLSDIPGNQEIEELQKTSILDTAHTLRKVLRQKYKTFNMGNNITFVINCKYRIATYLSTLETWFVSVIQLQIPCIKVTTNTTTTTTTTIIIIIIIITFEA